MTIENKSDHHANLFGSIWMVVGMAIFAIEDAFVKAAAVTLPVGQILIMFGLGGAFIFACVIKLNDDPLFVREVVSRSMLVRVFFEVIGRLFYVLAIALIPLSAATVILQATPLVVVAGAALLFGEKVGWRRWAAIIVGLVGILTIVQPGTDSFSMLSLLAVVGMIGFAGRDLASRAAPASISTWILGLYGFLAIIVAGILVSVWQATLYVEPSSEMYFYILGAILAGVCAYSCLMKAMRTGEVSAVTPFRYTRLLFGIALGIALFGEQLSRSTMVGSGLIVFSGLFILWRNKHSKTWHTEADKRPIAE